MSELTSNPRVGARAASTEPDGGSPFRVRIGALYEGPFDLLLDLIRRQNIDIYDIPIAAITAQYLQYMQMIRDLDVEVAAEFLMVAATLIQIKSRMLLPADPVLPGEAPAADPREELVQRLLEHERFKQAASLLHQRQQLEAASWSRPGRRDYPESEEPGELAVGIFDLVMTMQQVLRRLEERPRLEISADDVSVSEMMAYLHRHLVASEAPVAVRQLFAGVGSRRAMLALFLAVLEMVRRNIVALRQEKAFGEIWLRRHAQFHEAWAEYEESLR